LGRSDAVSVASLGAFIDLTEDNGEPDIEIVSARQIAAPRARARPARRERADSPPLFMPHAPAPPPREVNRVYGAVPPAPQALARPAAMTYAQQIQGRVQDMLQNVLGLGGAGGAMIYGNDEDIQRVLEHHRIHHAHAVQAMPNAMDYRHPAFRKPEHVAPPSAREHFTRSPTENDVVICPSCEQELVHNKDDEEPVLKKNGRAPTKKEREEHPFWVVKECGHVSFPVLSSDFSLLTYTGLLQQLLSKPHLQQTSMCLLP
jgi:hypothetical protein